MMETCRDSNRARTHGAVLGEVATATPESLGRRGPEFRRLLRQEELILDVTERFCEALTDAGVTRTELARRLDRSPRFVSQLLAGGRNLTLRTVADVAAALSLRVSFVMAPSLDRSTLPEPPRDGPGESG